MSIKEQALKEIIAEGTWEEATEWYETEEKVMYLCDTYDLLVSDLDLIYKGRTVQNIIEERLGELYEESVQARKYNPYGKEGVQEICDLIVNGSDWEAMVNETLVYQSDEPYLKIPLTYQGQELNWPQLADFFVVLHYDGFVSYENHSGCSFKFPNAVKVYEIIAKVFKDK